MGIAMGLDGMMIDEAAAGFGGAAMSIGMGLYGMGIDEAASGLGGAAMNEAVGLNLSMSIVLAGVRGQTRGTTMGLPNCSGRTGEARQNWSDICQDLNDPK